MTTASEFIIARAARYARVERVTDSIGRTIGVKQLKPSQQVRVQEMVPALEGTTTVRDEETGKSFEVPRSSPMVMAASVVEVDGQPFTFPKSRADLDAVLDMLDGEGLTAVAEALGKLAQSESGEAVDGAEAAKNGSASPASAKLPG